MLVKYTALPTGLMGLKNALNSRRKSWEVTWRAGVVFQSTPGLMWKVYTVPPPVIPPLAVVGT